MSTEGIDKVYYYEILRVIACFSVVIIHVEAYWFNKYDFLSFNWYISAIMCSLFRFAVPVFFMISGALTLRKDYSAKEIAGKILRMAGILCIWNLVYAVYSRNFSLSSLILGHFHLWYLYVLIGMYVLTPLLKVIADNRGRYFIALGFIFGVLVPTCITVMEFFDLSYAVGIKEMADSFDIHLPLGYSFYYVYGYFLSLSGTEDRKRFYIIGILGGFVIYLFTYTGSVYKGRPVEDFLGYLTPFCVMSATGVFGIVKKLFKGKEESRIIAFLADKTFGVYLIHALVLDIVLKYTNGLNSFVMSAITIIISVLTVSVLKKIPYIKKLV